MKGMFEAGKVMEKLGNFKSGLGYCTVGTFILSARMHNHNNSVYPKSKYCHFINLVSVHSLTMYVCSQIPYGA